MNPVKSVIKGNPDFSKPIPKKESFLKVAECFMDTIQGEGVNAGCPSVFLRMQHCMLNCQWCFHPNTKIQTVNGPKKIKNISEGEKLLTFYKGRLVKTTASVLMKRKVNIKDEIIKITFDNNKNHQIICTKNHEIYAKGKGWTEADDLVNGDIIMSLEKYQITSYHMSENNPMKNQGTVKKAITKLKEGYKSGRIKSYERSTKHRRLQSELKIGDSNPMKNHETRKKNTISHNYAMSSLEKSYKDVFEQNKYSVYYCENEFFIGDDINGYKFPDFKVSGKKKVIEVYDTTNINYKEGKRTYKNYEEPRQNHYKKFGYECLFLTQEDLKFSDIKDIIFSFIYNGQTITNIESGDEISNKSYVRLFGNLNTKETEVYNLSCYPYNTYIANKAWVHNCDTTEVWRRGNPYTIDELIELFDKEGVIRRLRDGHHLVLTGGSPLIQQRNLHGLIWTINLKYGFWPYIEVENECVLWPNDGLMSTVNCWNNSPKLANSGNPAAVRYYQPDLLKFMSEEFDNSWFKFVITSEKDLNEIANKYLAKDLIRYDQIILMPEGADRKGIQKNQEMVVKMAIENGFRYSPRLQVDIWDKATGV